MLKKFKNGDLKLLIILSSIIATFCLLIQIDIIGDIVGDILFIAVFITFGLSMLLIPISILLFFYIIIISIVKLIKNKSIKYIIPIIILSLCFIPIDEIMKKNDFKSKYDDRMKIVEDIKDGKLSYNEYGVLDKKFDKLALNGVIEVVYLDGDDCVIGFFYDDDFLLEDGWLYYSSKGIDFLKEHISSHINFIENMNDNWFYVHF